jgi:hypothetical protein
VRRARGNLTPEQIERGSGPKAIFVMDGHGNVYASNAHAPGHFTTQVSSLASRSLRPVS